MSLTIRTTREIEVPGYDGLWIEHTILPDRHDEVWVSEPDENGNIEVSWLVQDDHHYADDLIEWADLHTDPEQWSNGCFKDFRNQHDGGGQEARDAYIEEAVAIVGADNVFIVDVYAHGMEHFSVANTVNYPDRRWDVAPACVVVVPPDVTNPREYADGLMESWTNIVNGDVWGVVCVKVNPSTGETLRDESCWGFVGREYAEETARTFAV